MTQPPPTPAQDPDEGAGRGGGAALEAPRRADARQLPQKQPEIEATDVHEKALQDVGMSA